MNKIFLFLIHFNYIDMKKNEFHFQYKSSTTHVGSTTPFKLRD